MRTRAGALFALIAIAGAIVADARTPGRVSVPADRPPPIAGGLLACPIGTFGASSGWVNLANVGARPARVRVVWYPERGKIGERVRTLAPGAVASVRLGGAALKGSAAATVEFAGSQVVASHTLTSKAGAAAGVCSAPGPARIAVAGLRTLRTSATLSIFNPGTAVAVVRVALFADGKRIRPFKLNNPPASIEAHRRLDVRLSDFAFDARTITALVTTENGRVVVEGIQTSERGRSIVGGVPPAATLVAANVRRIIRQSDVTRTVTTVTTVGSVGTPLSGRVMRPSAQGSIPNLAAELAAGASTTVSSPSNAPVAGFVFEGAENAQLAAASRWVAGRPAAFDEAGLEATETGQRWAGVLGDPSVAARVGVVLVNHGSDAAAVQIRILGVRPRSIPLVVQPGRAVLQDVGSGPGVVAVEVVADQPLGVAMQSAAADRSKRFNVALPGTPVEAARAVPVTGDGRAGIPVRIGDIDNKK